MGVDEAQLAQVVAKSAITDCLARLARGEDRRDADLIRASWWPDASFDYGVNKGSFPEYLDWVVPGADAITNTQHVLGQSHLEWDGDFAARVETQVISYHRVDMGAGEQDTVIGGRYLDRFECREGDWRIADRTMLYDWFQDWGDAIDWSQGIMGLPFGDDRFPGRAKGDWSETFFGQNAS